MHSRNSFITLTYDDEHLPPDGGIHKAHWQRFAKRLRKRVGEFRYYHCGEYGEKTGRPHYHALLFGYQFPDLVPHSRNARGDWLYTSELLEETWRADRRGETGGHCYVGDVTFQSARYTAGYVTKKLTGAYADQAYGERQAPYATMSKHRKGHRFGGLGAAFADKYLSDMFPKDFITIEGRRYPIPRYYERWLPPDQLEKIREERIKKASDQDSSYERLKERERVAMRRDESSTRSRQRDV